MEECCPTFRSECVYSFTHPSVSAATEKDGIRTGQILNLVPSRTGPRTLYHPLFFFLLSRFVSLGQNQRDRGKPSPIPSSHTLSPRVVPVNLNLSHPLRSESSLSPLTLVVGLRVDGVGELSSPLLLTLDLVRTGDRRKTPTETSGLTEWRISLVPRDQMGYGPTGQWYLKTIVTSIRSRKGNLRGRGVGDRLGDEVK